ncbi:thioredoxin domain-containing protein [Parvimonas micra]|nr:thioredoxin domain-containing protein [Parvimonas micra]
MEKLREEYKDKVIIKTIDIRKQREFASQFPIKATPTLFYFNADGTPFKASDELAKKISYVAYEDKKSGELKFGGSEGVVKYEELKEVIEEMLKNVK